jgi:hypothetical protein
LAIYRLPVGHALTDPMPHLTTDLSFGAGTAVPKEMLLERICINTEAAWIASLYPGIRRTSRARGFEAMRGDICERTG